MLVSVIMDMEILVVRIVELVAHQLLCAVQMVVVYQVTAASIAYAFLILQPLVYH